MSLPTSCTSHLPMHMGVANRLEKLQNFFIFLFFYFLGVFLCRFRIREVAYRPPILNPQKCEPYVMSATFFVF